MNIQIRMERDTNKQTDTNGHRHTQMDREIQKWANTYRNGQTTSPITYKTHTQMERHIHKSIDTYTNQQTHTQINKHIHKSIDTYTNGQTQMDRHTPAQMDRHTPACRRHT